MMTNTNQNKDNFSKIINDAINNMDFNDISKKIKNGLDLAIKSTIDLIGNRTYDNRLKINDPKICSQKLPEKSKASGLKFLSIISILMGITSTIAVLSDPTFRTIIPSLIIIAISALLTVFPWKRATYIEKISKNYVRFLRELGPNSVIAVKDLASAVQQDQEETVTDLLYMMQKEYFHQARIVENNSLFLLDIETFKLYKKENERLEKNSDTKEYQLSSKDQKAQEIIDRACKYLEEIDKSKDKIRDENFRKKTIAIKSTIENIIAIIKKYPEKSHALDKFMDYYLPTTVKLIDTYIEFEMMRSDDKRILNSMQEIDKSIQTIDEAYKRIQVELLSDRTMDIKTDIDTLKLLLNQEGLLGDDWSKNE